MKRRYKLFAAAPGTLDFIIERVEKDIINPSLKVLIPVAIVVFMWGVLQFIMNAEDTEAHEKGKRHLVWSLVGFVIMILVFGIINLIKKSIAP